MVAIFFDQQLINSWTYVMQGYYLIGTYFTYYTNVSKSEEIHRPIINYMPWIFDEGLETLEVNYKTGIYNKGLETHEVNGIKALFQPHEITIMEGSCRVKHINEIVYGCLTGLFVDSQHLEGLKENEIEVVQGGFIRETDFYSTKPEIKKFSWGTMNIPTSRQLAASFYSQGFRCVYFYLEYGSNKPALISHLWHGDDLVLGNKENIALTSCNVLGNQILQSYGSYELLHNKKCITFTLSISWS